ncbi:Probable RNA-directed DNA polymerase from transposon X-element [Eumeta japonica]|uniref:Probable RNA-directed DNA polymerase from transposon X-element n=1 Tax=Eumeta variegata TaxID=151549 RepID=A0A4C1W9T6_EUMVA|nr:Probable RNA-directed DNA polymerase from transposon X-element [Eumeta japonica]
MSRNHSLLSSVKFEEYWLLMRIILQFFLHSGRCCRCSRPTRTRGRADGCAESPGSSESRTQITRIEGRTALTDRAGSIQKHPDPAVVPSRAVPAKSITAPGRGDTPVFGGSGTIVSPRMAGSTDTQVCSKLRRPPRVKTTSHRRASSSLFCPFDLPLYKVSGIDCLKKESTETSPYGKIENILTNPIVPFPAPWSTIDANSAENTTAIKSNNQSGNGIRDEEKLIVNQLTRYFYNNNLTNVKQFGFTKGRSTTEASVELIEQIFGVWKESQEKKLRHYGVASLSLGLLESYLSGRVQTVDINGERSSESAVSLNVPQDSVLGPLLFLIYINDLLHLVKDEHGVVLFADDTSLLFKVNRQEPDSDEVNSTILKVVKWFKINDLLLNKKKTKIIKFSFSNTKLVDTKAVIRDEILNIMDMTLFLGLSLDTKLRWNFHIRNWRKSLVLRHTQSKEFGGLQVKAPRD